jgi:hypothetical protein
MGCAFEDRSRHKVRIFLTAAAYCLANLVSVSDHPKKVGVSTSYNPWTGAEARPEYEGLCSIC